MRILGWGVLLLASALFACDSDDSNDNNDGGGAGYDFGGDGGDNTGGDGGNNTGGDGGGNTGGDGGDNEGGGPACGWQKRIGGFAMGRLLAVKVLRDGRLFVAGKATRENVLSAPSYWALLEPDGGVVWEKTGAVAFEPNAATEATDGRLLLAGGGSGMDACDNPQGMRDVVLWTVSRTSGEVLSKRCVGGTDDEDVKAVRDAGDEVIVVGSSLSSDASGNVNESPNPGFQVADLLIAHFGEQAYGELFGSRGPDAASGFLQGGAILGTTMGDDSGDLVGQPSLGFSDLWLIAPQIVNLCGVGRCASDGRWGGANNDTVAATTESGWFVGSTASTEEHFCATEAGTPVAWLGHFLVTESGGGFTRTDCVNARDAQLFAVGANDDAVVAAGKGTKIDELDDAETPDGGSSGALLLAFDKDLRRTLAVIAGDTSTDRFLGVDVTEDGCIVAVGRRDRDGWIYTRPLP